MAGDPTLIDALFIGALQGATEWLPVSSSGHLVLAQESMGVEVPIFFDAVLHLGTLAVVMVFLRKDIYRILRGFLSGPKAMRGGHSAKDVWWADIDRRLGLLVLVGSVPTALIGLVLRPQFESLFSSTLAVGVGLLITGAFLALLPLAAATRGDGRPGLVDALLIGAAQGAAIAPGLSRSGATICAALFRGVEREFAVRLSFLLSIPAIAGASLLQATGQSLDAAAAAWPVYLVGAATAAAVGWASLFLLVRTVRGAKMHYFAPYCLALGAIVVAWSLGALG